MSRHDEANLQITIVNYIRSVAPDLVFFHVPNGGKRSKSEAGRFKAMGVLAGVADLIFWWSDHYETKTGAIEIKTDKGSLQPSQKEFRDRFLSIGGKYALARSIDDVRAIFADWGIKTREVHYCPTRWAEGVVIDHRVRSKRKGATS